MMSFAQLRRHAKQQKERQERAVVRALMAAKFEGAPARCPSWIAPPRWRAMLSHAMREGVPGDG